jgi:steroid 5-alpha reductase family enzyme
MSVLTLLATNAVVLIACFVLLWAICLKTRDVTPVDSFWAFGMVVMAVSSFLLADGLHQRKLLILGLTAFWGVRLGSYMIWRWRSHGTDRRYVSLLGKAEAQKGWSFGKASALLVFATQAPLLFIVCLPAQLGQVAVEPPLGNLAMIGAALSVFGVLFEAIGDFQLVAFKRNPANQGKVMRSGLWRYTRHPNYFGDACAWWGIYLVAAETGPGAWSFVGPALLTWTLMKWSGAPTVEHKMKRTKPDYADYMARTSGFVPWPPKRV